MAVTNDEKVSVQLDTSRPRSCEDIHRQSTTTTQARREHGFRGARADQDEVRLLVGNLLEAM
jgi:hypothetical protein